MRLALAVCALVLVAPATAHAELPVISYVDENGVFRLYEAESNREVEPPPPVPVADPASFRYGISLSGRYIAFTDAGKKSTCSTARRTPRSRCLTSMPIPEAPA